MIISKYKQIALWLVLIFLIPFFCTIQANLSTKSAYEIAVQNGFVGSEQDWLSSLKGNSGKSAYEIAVQNGFVGSEQDWLLSLRGNNGTDGKDGENKIEDTYTIYTNAKKNGEIDESTSYIEFLNQILGSSNSENANIIQRNLFSVVSVFTYRENSSYSNHTSAGSGVIYQIDENGDAFIITNYHVVYSSSTGRMFPYFKITLFGQDDNYIPATLYGATRKYDLAVLKVTASEALKNSNAEAVTICDTPVSLGAVCYSIGNTNEYGLTVSRGIVSVESEMVSMKIGNTSNIYREFRHDSFISHGNSGGGLFNTKGELIGITNCGRENTLINYAIPTNIVRSVINNLIKNKTDDSLSYLKVYQTGIENGLTAKETISIFDPETSKINILEKIEITSIADNSLIKNLGAFNIGDELVSIKYKGVTYDNFNLKTYTLSELLLESESGDEVEITVKRNNTIEEIPGINEEPTIITRTITLSEEYSSILA